MKPNRESAVYEFGGFRLDAGKRLLWNDGQPAALTPKAFDTLLYLVRNAGQTVHKDELMAAIWPDTVVEENNLNKNISILRHVLGEKRGEHRFIATVPGKGYRFVASVAETGSSFSGMEKGASDGTVPRLIPSPTDVPAEVVRGSFFSHRNWFLAVLTVIFILAGSYLSRSRGSLHFGAIHSREVAERQLPSPYDLDLSDTEGQLFLAHFYSRDDGTPAPREQAGRPDPLTINHNVLAGQFLYYAGRHDEAIDSLQQAIELHPHHWLPRMLLARSYIEKEMYREAIASCEEAKRLGSSSLELIALEGWSYAKLGDTKRAYGALKELDQISQQKRVPSYFPALIHNALGDTEMALSLLEQGWRHAMCEWPFCTSIPSGITYAVNRDSLPW